MSKKENWLIRALKSVIPVVQDPPREWVRKVAFLMAFLLFVGSGYYLLDELWWQPKQTQDTVNTLRDYYYSDDAEDPSQEGGQPDTTVYPDGMIESFRRLYRLNPDIRGWLTFKTAGGDLFEGAIDNPVVQTTDNDYYLNHDFLGKTDKAGTLYFDSRNRLNAGAENRNLIIYGHNLTSGLMFSKFNQLVRPNLSRGKLLTTLTLSTLFEKREYKVVAVFIANVKENEGPVFNYLRTEFSTEKSFLSFVEQIRRRSIYDYNDVDVQAGDELLTLSSCTNRRESYLNDGRVVVVARRVREGEDPSVDASKTTLNDDVLMPKAWYMNQGLAVPDEYKTVLPTTTTKKTTTTTRVVVNGQEITTTTVTGESTTVTGETTTVTGESTTVTGGGMTTVTTTTVIGGTTVPTTTVPTVPGTVGTTTVTAAPTQTTTTTGNVVTTTTAAQTTVTTTTVEAATTTATDVTTTTEEATTTEVTTTTEAATTTAETTTTEATTTETTTTTVAATE